MIVSKHSKVSKPLINAINKSGGKIKVRYGKINIILIDNIYKFKNGGFMSIQLDIYTKEDISSHEYAKFFFEAIEKWD